MHICYRVIVAAMTTPKQTLDPNARTNKNPTKLQSLVKAPHP